jgi:ribonuclease HI
MSELITIHTDGGARGNPGPAAYAFVLARPGQPDVEEAGCIGNSTNNVAEYTALVRALERAKELGGRNVLVHSDSELMVKQMNGEYKVKHDGLKALFDEANALRRQFERVTFRHVRREHNKRADELYNMALDGASPRKTTSAAHAPGSPAKVRALPVQVRDDLLDCLRSAACAWSAGDPNHPRAEEVWEQLWFILEESGTLKTVRR